SDFSDVQGGTTGEGIHTGMMGGTLMIALHDFAGIKASANQLSINPRLPDSLQKISLSINYKGNNYKLDISNNKVVIYLKKERKTGVKIKVGSNELTLKEKEKREVELND
ncbi:MAG: glycosyl hydrolase family 65 protein, partial [Bacteroidota bacterium]